MSKIMSGINNRLVVFFLSAIEIIFALALMEYLGFWSGFSLVSWLTTDPKTLFTVFCVAGFFREWLENWLNVRYAKAHGVTYVA